MTATPIVKAYLLIALACLFPPCFGLGGFRGWSNREFPLRRLVPAEYDDGKSTPRAYYKNFTLPSARRVSNLVARQEKSIPDPTGLNSLFWTWGQFIDHDMVAVKENEDEYFNIPVPPDNSRFSALVDELTFKRSVSINSRRKREQLNTISPSIDASQVYGSSKKYAKSLRTDGGNGCFLETSEGDFMKWDKDGETFLAGDDRVAEQPTLTALHAVFMREHNRLARVLMNLPGMIDNHTIYETARLLVAAEIQSITRKEFLPRLIGFRQADYRFRRSAKPSIFNEFATACFRFGHTMVPSDLHVGSANYCSKKTKKISLRESFFNPKVFKDRGIDAVLRGTVIQPAESLDLQIVSDLRDFLFESKPGQAFGVDLASFNIQRGRDHGIPNYCTVLKKLGFKSRRLDYSDITSDKDLADSLRQAYGEDPCAMDLWVASLAEDKKKGSLLGKTCSSIIKTQFLETFRSDPYDASNIDWRDYGLDKNPQLGSGLRLDWVTLSQLIRKNSRVGASFPPDAFSLRSEGKLC